MYSTFLGACLASVALSLTIESQLQLPDTSPVEYFFSQTEADAISTAICQRTANRNKEAVPDFYKLYAGSTVFTDTTFPHTSANVLSWADAKETWGSAYSSYTWKRAKDNFSDHTLFGSKGVTPQDMLQGSIGNCWFISAASALSEHPGRVEKIFLNANNEISKNGIYAVQFYTLGVPTQSLLTTTFHFNHGVENSPRFMPHPQPTKPSSVLSSRKPLPSTTATTVISLAVTQD